MHSVQFRLFLTLLSATLMGCGTVDNLVPVTPCADGGGGGPANFVYGGLRSSVRDGWSGITHPSIPSEVPVGICLLTLDAPASLIADTLTLPITVPAAIDRRQRSQYQSQLHDAVSAEQVRIQRRLKQLEDRY